jgi:4-carboxymuconolactone decarboxylase
MTRHAPGARAQGTAGGAAVTHLPGDVAMLPVPGAHGDGSWDPETAALVRLAAVLAGGTEAQLEAMLHAAAGARQGAAVGSVVRAEWVEELLLQTYLFAGFPRALNGMRAWRLVSGRPAPTQDDGARARTAWTDEGVRTCEAVYGAHYPRLRAHVQALHPALDAWMLEEGYGKVLSRAALDLARRELCIVAACAATRQPRQLRAHLRGALQVGVPARVVVAALEALEAVVPEALLAEARVVWGQVHGG